MPAELCPIHRCPLELSYRGTKRISDLPTVSLEGLPMLYCPQCLAEGKDSARELDATTLNTFIAALRKLLDKSTFTEHLHKPTIALNFNPHKSLLEKDGLAQRHASAAHSSGAHDDIKTRLENFTPQRPLYSLDRLILDEATHTAIREALNLVEQQQLIYDTWNLKSIDRTGRKVALNFYGLPGTGKTLAADAVANFLGREILLVSYAELESKYVGETPKNIRAAFAKAREANAVLFFDEADSILGKRLTSVTQSADHSVNLTRSTTLIELDRFNGLVIFASNLVGNYDAAFLRRMIAHIEFHLPKAAERAKIWKAHLPPQLPVEAHLNIDQLAELSEGASGGDIKNAVLLAASYASMRQKAEQVVRFDDFSKAIEFVLRGKSKVAAMTKT